MYKKMEVKIHIYLLFSLSGSTICITTSWMDPRLSQHATAKANSFSCSNIYPTRFNVTQFFYLETTLHVLGDTTTHHQELKQLYLQHLVFVTPLLLPAAIVEELEPV
jgi:hypothetical protein